MPISDDERERCDAYFDGELPQEKEAEFRQWLRADPMHMRDFVRHAHLHRALRDQLKGRGVRHVEASLELKERASIPRHWKMWGAVAAVLVCAGYLLYKFTATDPKLTVYTARIEKLLGDVVIVDQTGAERKPARVDDYLLGKSGLEFDGPGQVVMKYLDGTSLDLTVTAGKSALRLSRGDDKQVNQAKLGKRVTVENGVLRVAAATQPEGSPLIISTPVAEVTVVGTSFQMEVTVASTRLDVAEGRFRIPRYSDAASADVSAAEYVIVKSQGPILVQRALPTPN